MENLGSPSEAIFAHMSPISNRLIDAGGNTQLSTDPRAATSVVLGTTVSGRSKVLWAFSAECARTVW